MSYTLGGLIACQTIQEGLDRVFNTADPASLRESLGGLEWILSPENRNGTQIQQLLSPGNGKKRSVRVIYNQEIPETDVQDSVETVCESENDYEDHYSDYELPDVGSSIDRRFDLIEMAEICEGDREHINRWIDAMVWAMDQRVATKSIAQLPEFVGKFAVGEASVNGARNLKTIYFKKSNGDASDRAIASISFATRNAGYRSMPVILGFGEEIDLYFQRMAAGCCYQGGWDFGQIMRNNRKAFIEDRRMADVFTANHLLSLDAGAVQFISYNEFKGERGLRVIDTDNYKQTVVRSRYTGLEYDFILNNVNCGSTVTAQLKLRHKLIGLPTDRYPSGHRLNGTTGVNEYAATQEA